jgi:hypothetical protein
MIIVFPEQVFEYDRQFGCLFGRQRHKGLAGPSEDPFPGDQMLRQKMLGKKSCVEEKHEAGAIQGTVKSIAGGFVDRFCRPGDDSEGFAV